MRVLSLSSLLLAVARLLVLAGIGMCIAQFYFAHLAVLFIVAGSLLSLVAYLLKSRRLSR